MKQVLLLLWVFLGLSFSPSGRLSAHVEKTYYLKGKAGARDLAVRMLCYDEMPTRHLSYFFLDDKHDRRLTGSLVDGFWTFVPEEPPPAGGAGVRLKIAEGGQGRWNGTWTDASGKSSGLLLTELDPQAPAAFAESPFLKEPDPYDSYKLANTRFVKTRTERTSREWECDWYAEEGSGIAFFRLRSPAGLPADSVNESLRALHLSLVQQYFAAAPGKELPKVEARVLYLAGRLVSLQLLARGPEQEGRAAPASRFVTLDCGSGAQVDLEQLLWFGDSAGRPSPDDLYKIFRYRKAVFAPRLFGLLQELYPARMNSDSCGRNQAESWALPVWALTQKGMAFGFPAGVPCAVWDWAVVPYEKLAPYLDDRYRLAAKP